MASIDIQLSQNVYGHQTAVNLGAMFDTVEQGTYNIAATYSSNTSWSLNGSTLVVKYADGAVETFGGFTPAQAGATQGSATVSDYQFQLPNGFVNTYKGTLNVTYAINGGNIVFDVDTKGFVLNSAGYATQMASTDANYDAANGNTAVTVKGAFLEASGYAMSGTLSQLALTSDKFLLSQTVDGDFSVSGNVLTDGAHMTNSVVTGTVSGLHQTYADGSHVSIDGVSTGVAASAGFDWSVLANTANLGGNDTINVSLPDTVTDDLVIAAGAGNDQITVKGGNGHLNVDAGDGNDRISLLGGAHKVDGGSGIDTVVLAMARANATVVHNQADDSVVVTDNTGAVNVLTGVERIEFSDVTVALDASGNGGEAYRLYQAAFNRAPDSAGLGYWIDALDRGASLTAVAQAFTASAEYQRAYAADTSHTALITHYYQNILHRAPDAAGLNYWVGVLDTNKSSVSDVLASISESTENKAALVGVIANGFTYTPFHH